MNTLRRLLSTIAAALLVALASVSQVHASDLTTSGQSIATGLGCGTVITTDTRLISDLMNCPNSGIVIGADNITLDLNGHTVGGDGTPFASCPAGAFCDLGIDNTAGHSGVTIKNGAVRGFNVGIFVLGAGGNRIQSISVTETTTFGIMVFGSTGTRLDDNSLVADGISGIRMFDSHDGRIENNLVTGEHGYAIIIRGCNHLQLDGNVLDGNAHGFLLGDSIINHSNNNDVYGNRIFHSGGSSIDLGGASGNRVWENVLSDNGDGVILFESNNNQISDNSVKGTGAFGFPDTGGFGIIMDGAHNNLVEGNVVTGGRKGPAIFVTSLDSQGTSDGNVVVQNVANTKFSDGILVNAGATATLVEGNTTNQNGYDGIEVDAPGTTVTGNTANDNVNLGIEAVPGVIDGGGNSATRNGNPLQCTNVICS